MNGKLELTYREIHLMAYLMNLDKTWLPSVTDQVKNVIGTPQRRSIIKELLINKNNLSMYLKSFKASRLIIPFGKEGWIVNPVYMPEWDEKGQITVTHIVSRIDE